MTHQCVQIDLTIYRVLHHPFIVAIKLIFTVRKVSTNTTTNTTTTTTTTTTTNINTINTTITTTTGITTTTSTTITTTTTTTTITELLQPLIRATESILNFCSESMENQHNMVLINFQFIAVYQLHFRFYISHYI